jgi:hypothetical protein
MEIRRHTSAWGSHSFGGASAERREFLIANNTRFFPGVGNGTFDTMRYYIPQRLAEII